ncbi:MAG: hypothetical protein ACRDP3_20415, partial [Streptomyces sp.]
MNAPHDGDQGRTPADSSPPPEDPYERGGYPHDPYPDRDPATVQIAGAVGPRGQASDGEDGRDRDGRPDESHDSGDDRGQDVRRGPDDAFAHLFRDQGHQQPATPPQPRTESAPGPQTSPGGGTGAAPSQPLPELRKGPDPEPEPKPGQGPGFEAAHPASAEAT